MLFGWLLKTQDQDTKLGCKAFSRKDWWITNSICATYAFTVIVTCKLPVPRPSVASLVSVRLNFPGSSKFAAKHGRVNATKSINNMTHLRVWCIHESIFLRRVQFLIGLLTRDVCCSKPKTCFLHFCIGSYESNFPIFYHMTHAGEVLL